MTLTPSAYTLLGLTAIVAGLVAIVVFAVLRFSAAAADTRRNLRGGGTETALLSAALQEAVTKLKAQERATAARADASERLSGEIISSLTAGLLVAGLHGEIRILNPAGLRMLDLPDTLQPSGPESYTVDVEDLKKVPPLSFGIAKRVRPVRRVVFGPTVVTPPAEAKPPVKRPAAPAKPAVITRPAAPASPAEVRRLRELGIRQYAAGEYQQALRTWQQLLKLDPANAEAKRNLQRTQAKLDAQNKARH